jgi:hypothetical protein
LLLRKYSEINEIAVNHSLFNVNKG